MQPAWGRVLQSGREARGWSIRWAAKQAGMSDVFWAQMERGWKRTDGQYVEVTPSLGSLLQAASALRMTERETDDLVTSAGHAPLPRRYVDGARPVSVVEAVENDPNLLDEAKQHLLNQYELLLRIAPAEPSDHTGNKNKGRPSTPAVRPLRAAARRGRPEGS